MREGREREERGREERGDGSEESKGKKRGGVRKEEGMRGNNSEGK